MAILNCDNCNISNARHPYTFEGEKKTKNGNNNNKFYSSIK